MLFLLAEILNFQGSTHQYGVGSFSKKELLGLMQKAVKLEVEKNGNEASRYCPVILHQPKRPKKLK